MQKAQFNKATGAYDKRDASAQAGEDAAKAGNKAPDARSEHSGVVDTTNAGAGDGIGDNDE
jgi:hypothetical protein